MAAGLRPMNLGEIFDRSFDLYRKNLLLFVGIATIPTLFMLCLHVADIAWLHVSSKVHPPRQPGIFLWQLALAFGYYHISGLVDLLFLPVYVDACSRKLFDEQTSIVNALRSAAFRWRSYLWIATLKHLSQLIVPEILSAALMYGIGTIADKLGFFNGTPPVPVVIAIICIVLLPPVFLFIFLFLWTGSFLALAMPGAAIEQVGGIKALQRSWLLSKGGRRRIIFTWASFATITWTFMAALQTLIWEVVVYVYREELVREFNRLHYELAMYALFAVIRALVNPIYPIALTLLYYDQRVRREGFDLERMMETAGLTSPAAGEDVVNEAVIKKAEQEHGTASSIEPDFPAA